MKCPQCQTENRADSQFCINCGASMNVVARPDEGVRRPPSANKIYAQGKNPTLAAILSLLVPGIGQFYNGDVLKGIVMLVGAIVLSSTVWGYIYIAILGWSIIDAYQVAKGNQSLWS
ncbi:zinc ribbon domain-containing protein [Nostoc sp. LEGE 12450]|uniref:zinc ribbon domain-containing protein n=1 Tax=Nostoc sp. LEGE 12450 TaxID=1828643 RepID=UPI001882AFD7|nr:zinc ribbon domain-containing protein [Nostoc sp. LEGE 12450]MBE8990050.1 TM2 domain-containing protein [Nostoc sp. LEGE 12450]